jgi:nicotinic acid phosphoribosyltransferase
MGALQYGPLHADFYAFTMGKALFREGKIDTPSTFQSFIRKPPFGGSYLLVAGLNDWLDWLREWQFKPEYIAWLATQTHPSGKRRADKTSCTTKISYLPSGDSIIGPFWGVGPPFAYPSHLKNLSLVLKTDVTA